MKIIFMACYTAALAAFVCWLNYFAWKGETMAAADGAGVVLIVLGLLFLAGGSMFADDD